jgi:hypothetical protein
MSKLLAAWVVTLILIFTVMLSAQPASASNGATFDFDLHRTSPNLSLDNNAPTAAAAKPGDSISINPVTAATGSAGTTIGLASQSRSLPQVSAAGFHLDGVANDVSCTGTTGTNPATTASCSLGHVANVLVVINTAVAGTTTVSSVTVGTSSATALTGGR